MSFDKYYCDALSLTRLRRELPPGGSLFMFIYAFAKASPFSVMPQLIAASCWIDEFGAEFFG